MSYLPDLRASLVEAAHRQRAIAGNDQGQAPRSSGGLRRPWGWPRPGVGAAGTLLAAAIAAAVAVVALTLVGPREPATGPSSPAGSSAAANEAAAHAAAVRILDQLILPRGAVQTGLVRGIPADLWSPSNQLGTGHRVDVHRVWRLPGNPRSAIRFIEAHPPAGSRLGPGSETTGGPPFVVDTATEVLLFPGGPRTIIWRELAVAAVAIRGGGTALRADGEAGWLIPRPASERIPAGADHVRATTTKPSKRRGQAQESIFITSTARIQALVTLLNALPRAQTSSGRCVNDQGVRVRFAFHARGPVAPLAIAVYNPDCNRIALAIGGRPQPDLMLGLPDQDLLQDHSRITALLSFAPKPPSKPGSRPRR
jgi:hypothetical protein